MSDRRNFFTRISALGWGLVAGAHSQQKGHEHYTQPAAPARKAVNLPLETPDLPRLSHKMVNGVKEFHLVAEVVRSEFLPGRVVDAWGFNGSVPGPTIEANEGDRVRVIFDNHLPEMSAVHWHGFEVPVEMDGSVGVGMDPVPPGGRFVYEFTLNQHGTFFYHSHFAMQEMMGMLGFAILHPRKPYEPAVDRDFGLILQEWALLPNNTVPNTLSMEFNWLTFNGKAGPDCTPMIVKHGERVRIRLINIGMDHHPIHVHGVQFAVTGTEGGRIENQSLWYPQNTVLVGVAQARTIEFEAKYLGDWMLHCHLPHHMMNQMVSMVGPIHHGGHGMHTGAGMEEGMGMLRKGDALSEEFGPALGRGLGVAADREQATTHLVGQHAEEKLVPGFPQDHWMVEDEKYSGKPENYGLRRGWTGGMMGMMTLLRVVTPELYDKIEELKRQQAGRPPKPPEPKEHKHEHKN
jgi:FtsP/CotA-like multicopper oxidase with cupredoxin domain